MTDWRALAAPEGPGPLDRALLAERAATHRAQRRRRAAGAGAAVVAVTLAGGVALTGGGEAAPDSQVLNGPDVAQPAPLTDQPDGEPGWGTELYRCDPYVPPTAPTPSTVAGLSLEVGRESVRIRNTSSTSVALGIDAATGPEGRRVTGYLADGATSVSRTTSDLLRGKPVIVEVPAGGEWTGPLSVVSTTCGDTSHDPRPSVPAGEYRNAVVLRVLTVDTFEPLPPGQGVLPLDGPGTALAQPYDWVGVSAPYAFAPVAPAQPAQPAPLSVTLPSAFGVRDGQPGWSGGFTSCAATVFATAPGPAPGPGLSMTVNAPPEVPAGGVFEVTVALRSERNSPTSVTIQSLMEGHLADGRTGVAVLGSDALSSFDETLTRGDPLTLTFPVRAQACGDGPNDPESSLSPGTYRVAVSLTVIPDLTRPARRVSWVGVSEPVRVR